MGIQDVRSAFEHAGHGGLRLNLAQLRYAGDDQQVLQVTGWHRDGTPFAVQTALFDGCPIARAKRLADDLVATHYGGQLMSAKVSGLARLMGALEGINAGADGLAGRLETACANLATEMATTGQIVGAVEQAHAQLSAMNRLYSNGGPSGPLPGSSDPSGAL